MRKYTCLYTFFVFLSAKFPIHENTLHDQQDTVKTTAGKKGVAMRYKSFRQNHRCSHWAGRQLRFTPLHGDCFSVVPVYGMKRRSVSLLSLSTDSSAGNPLRTGNFPPVFSRRCFVRCPGTNSLPTFPDSAPRKGQAGYRSLPFPSRRSGRSQGSRISPLHKFPDRNCSIRTRSGNRP